MTNMIIVADLEVYAVRSNGDIEEYKVIPNAFGGAIHIWLKLAQKYQIPLDFLDKRSFQHLWASITLMNKADQWVMAMTFDQMLIEKEHLPTLHRHLKHFLGQPGMFTKTLETLSTTMGQAVKDEEVQGMAFNQTSVVDTFWVIREKNGEAQRSYNIYQDTGHKVLTPQYLRTCNKE